MSVSKIMLNATGDQDDLINKNPEFTYFKGARSTHTKFAKTLIDIESNKFQNNDFSINFGETLDFTIDKISDLLSYITVKFVLEGDSWSNNTKVVPETLFALIDYIEIRCNDKILQRLSGLWMYTYYILFKLQSDNKHLFNSSNAGMMTKTSLTGSNKSEYTLHLPIPFWFSKSTELALPLCSLQYEKVSINIKLNSFDKITRNVFKSDLIIKDCKLLGEFIELNENEKMTFVQKPLEYLIEQIEYNGPNLISVKNEQSLRMKFKIDNSFLVKELIWICKE